jgi:hypothetical protein
VPSATAWRAPDHIAPAYRLNAVSPLPATPAGDLDFTWLVRSEGFFFVASDNRVFVKSAITDGP